MRACVLFGVLMQGQQWRHAPSVWVAIVLKAAVTTSSWMSASMLARKATKMK